MNPFSKMDFRERTVLGVLLVWVGFLFFHYFPLKTAFDLSFLSTFAAAFSQADFHKLADNWLHFLKNLSCSLLITFVLWRMGRKLLRWINLGITGNALRFCLEMALGIILANTLWLGLGFNGLWYDPLMWAAALALLGWAFWDLARSFLKIQKFPHLPSAGKLPLFLGFLGLLSLVLDVLQGMTPDVYYDALVYHLSTLQFWLFHHGIADFHTNLYSYFPFGGELYFMNGYFFAGSEGAKLLNAFSAGLCGLAAAGWVAEEAGWEKGLLAWAMVLTLPLVSATVWTSQNDVALAFFLVLFLYALMRWMGEKKGAGWAAAAGLLGGAALTVKYTALVTVAVSLITAGIFFWKKVFDRKKRAGGALILILMVLTLAPWLLKNCAFTGNGFYPYLSSVFGGRALPAENMAALLNDHQAAFNGSFSFRPWLARVLGTDLDKTIAPLLFGFLPFLFLGGNRNSTTRYLLFSSALLLVCGFLVSHQLRLMIPAFVVCFLAMALKLGDVEKKRGAYCWGAIAAVFGVLSLLSLGRLSADYYRTQELWSGAEVGPEYLLRAPQTGTYYWMAHAVNQFVSGQVLVVGDARGLYYSDPFLTNSVFDEQVLPKLGKEQKDAENIRKKLHEMGVDAIIVSEDEQKRLAAQNPFYRLDPVTEGKLAQFLQHWTDPLFWDGHCSLYRVRSSPAKQQPPMPDFSKFLKITL